MATSLWTPAGAGVKGWRRALLGRMPPMPFEDCVVCDSDLHVLEPADLWQRYVADEFKHAAPVGLTELRRDPRVRVKSQVLLKAGPVRPLKERGGTGIGWRREQEAAYAEAEAKGWGPEAQIDAMGKEGRRSRGPLPVARPLRTRARLVRADRRRRPRAGARGGDRARVQAASTARRSRGAGPSSLDRRRGVWLRSAQRRQQRLEIGHLDQPDVQRVEAAVRPHDRERGKALGAEATR